MEGTAAAGLVGVALWSLATAYRETAPQLGELRRAERDDVDHRQRLRDADLTVGGLALLAGLSASLLIRSVVPVVIVAAGFAWISGLHHIVLAGLRPDDI
jgi:hypothetical protein